MAEKIADRERPSLGLVLVHRPAVISLPPDGDKPTARRWQGTWAVYNSWHCKM